MSEKRLSIVLPNLTGGGAERVSVCLAQEFIKQGYRVDFVLMRVEGELLEQVPKDARVIDMKVYRLRDFPLPFSRYLKEEKPAAIQVRMWPLTVVSLIAHRLARSSARIVISDHNILSMQYAGRGRAHALALRASLALTYRLAGARVAVSGGVADDLASLSGIERGQFTVIHNPMPLQRHQEVEFAQAKTAWAGWTGKRIITVGRLKEVKNHALLIRAFKKLLETIDARLMIVGTGELAEQARDLIKSEGLTGKVIMPGHVLDPVPFYRSADLFVLSSNNEGFGNVIVEALACGTPVVSTNCPSGPAEILENGRYGILVPVGDEKTLAEAMEAALQKQHNKEALKLRAADFSPEIAAKKYLDLLFPDRKTARNITNE